jgi:hypothetical protein
VDQFLFHTEKSLQAISFLDAKEISLWLAPSHNLIYTSFFPPK